MPRVPLPPSGDPVKDAARARKAEAQRARRQAKKKASEEPEAVSAAAGDASLSFVMSAPSTASTGGPLSSNGSVVVVQQPSTEAVSSSNQATVLLGGCRTAEIPLAGGGVARIFSYIDVINNALKIQNVNVSEGYSADTFSDLKNSCGEYEAFVEDTENSRHLLIQASRASSQEIPVFYYQFEGQGQRKTPCGTLSQALQVLMMLPGRTGALIREPSVRTLVRLLGGDESLIDEVREFRSVQDHLAAHDPDNEWRYFAEEAARVGRPSSRPAPCDKEEDLEILRSQQEKRKIEQQMKEDEEVFQQRKKLRDEEFRIAKERLEQEACVAKERLEQEARVAKERLEQEALAAKEKCSLEAAEQVRRSGVQMQKYDADESEARGRLEKLQLERASTKARLEAELKEHVRAGRMLQVDMDRLLGRERVLLRSSLTDILTKIWHHHHSHHHGRGGEPLSRQLPNGFAQIFFLAYQQSGGTGEGDFGDKPVGDFCRFQGATPQGVLWYREDLPAIWRKAENLHKELIKKRRQGAEPLMPDAARPAEPTLAVLCQRMGVAAPPPPLS